MSTILDALKRSEAERRQTDTAPAASGPALPRPARVGWLWIPALLVAGLLAGWLLFGREPADTVATPDPGAVPARTASAADTAAESAPSRDHAPVQAPEPVAVDVPRPTAPPQPEPMATVPDETVTDEPTPTEQPAVEQERPEDVVSEPPARPARVDLTPPPRSRPTEPGAATTAAPVYPLVTTLPPGPERTLFADSAINVHVWSEDPARRFVLINLKRHEEGDALGDGMAIAEIVPDGVVVEIDGERYLWQAQGR